MEDRGQNRAESEQVRRGNPHLWEIRWVQDLMRIAAVLLLIGLISWLQAIFQPLILGLLFAYLLNPIVVWCERRWKRQRLTVLITLSSVAVLCLLVFAVSLVPMLISQAVDFAENLPRYADSLVKRFGVTDEVVLSQVRDQASKFLRDPVTGLSRLWNGFVTSFGVVSGIVGTIASFSMGIALFPVYLFFFSWKLPNLLNSLDEFLPKSRRTHIHEVLAKMDAAVGGYFRTRLIIALIMGVLYAVGWSIAGVPYWLLLGFLGGLLGIIPYAATLAWLAAVLLQYLNLDHAVVNTSDLWTIFVWPTVVYALVQASDDWLLTPWLQGQELNMSFITIILAVLIGGSVAGILGMLLAVPAAACVSILWTDLIRPHLVSFADSH